MTVRFTGYLLIAVSAALFSAPIAPVPKTGLRPRARSLSPDSRRMVASEFVTAFADQLRAGFAPGKALSRAAASQPALGILVNSESTHEEIIAELRRNTFEGAEALAKVALFLDLSNERGTPLLPALEAIIGSLDAELAISEELQSEVASAKATATLLSLIPLIVLLALHPFHFLFGTLIGRLALVGAVSLNLLGRFWISRISQSATVIHS